MFVLGFFESIEQYPSTCESGLLKNAASRQLSGLETNDADMFGPNLLGLAMLLTLPELQPAQPFTLPPAKGSLQMLLHKNAKTGAT